MFGLFKKKNDRVPVTDCIWMTEQAKWDACIAQYRQAPSTLFMAWFEESRQKLESYGLEHGLAITAKLADFSHNSPGSQSVIFIEHFPLQGIEQQKFRELALDKVTVYSSLDEPLFRTFGGEKITSLMLQMGMQPSEMITHKMVTASVAKAQEKIADKMQVAVSARSQADWLRNAGIDNNA